MVHLLIWFLRNDCFKANGATMKTRTHAADYYRRMLSVEPHALKRLDVFAKIMACNRGQEIPNNPGPAATGTMSLSVQSGDAPCVRTVGGKSSI